MDLDVTKDALTDVEGGVADDLRARAEMDQSPKPDRVGGVGRRLQDPRLEAGFEGVDLDFEVTDFFGEFGVVESIKAVSDLVSPVSGTVAGVNEELFDAPELLNQDPYGDGWMIEVEPSDEGEFDDLLTADEYREQTE